MPARSTPVTPAASTEAGATDVVPEALEGSLQVAGRVLAGIGLPDEAVDARLDVQREAEVRLIGDLHGRS